MDVKDFMDVLKSNQIEFFTGVPDSQLKALCDYLMHTEGISKNHIIAANEGNATALAAGHYMATGKVPLVYMQNSGIGNALNPVASLLDAEVYGIPVVFVVGWRGEPGQKDEPQHIFQGKITISILEELGIKTIILDNEMSKEKLYDIMKDYKILVQEGKSLAFVVKKGALKYDGKAVYENTYVMLREKIIDLITDVAGDDIMVCTTGKASRELFEIRERKKQSHEHDFLTVGSMGHASSIALGIALEKKEKKVWCIDGDGAALMHMGAMAVIGSNKPHNFVHVILNNESHETVGGMSTVMKNIKIADVALACGYQKVYKVFDYSELKKVLEIARSENYLTLVEVKTSIGARDDLGRPTTTAKQNKEMFMNYLEGVK